MAEIQFCNQCYYMRTCQCLDEGKTRSRYICANGRSQRSDYDEIDFWQQACTQAKPRDWRPPSITPPKKSKETTT